MTISWVKYQGNGFPARGASEFPRGPLLACPFSYTHLFPLKLMYVDQPPILLSLLSLLAIAATGQLRYRCKPCAYEPAYVMPLLTR